MTGFVETSPTADAYWRSIILFGGNSASYKFALGKALLEAAARGQNFVPLEELAEPYARNLVEHLRRTDRQGTAASSLFLEACRGFARLLSPLRPPGTILVTGTTPVTGTQRNTHPIAPRRIQLRS